VVDIGSLDMIGDRQHMQVVVVPCHLKEELPGSWEMEVPCNLGEVVLGSHKAVVCLVEA